MEIEEEGMKGGGLDRKREGMEGEEGGETGGYGKSMKNAI